MNAQGLKGGRNVLAPAHIAVIPNAAVDEEYIIINELYQLCNLFWGLNTVLQAVNVYVCMFGQVLCM